MTIEGVDGLESVQVDISLRRLRGGSSFPVHARAQHSQALLHEGTAGTL